MDYQAELRNWTYTEHMGIGRYHGYIYGDKKGRFEDGTYVHTSQVMALSGDVAQTKCSKYKLIPNEPKPTDKDLAQSLADALEGGPTSGPDFLEWIADRLVNVYGESDNVDFVLSLRLRAQQHRAALANYRKGE